MTQETIDEMATSRDGQRWLALVCPLTLIVMYRVFSLQVIKSGTLADKVAALTLAVKQSPRTGLGSLDTLLAMLKKKSRREQVITLDAISALFKDQLLPADNKLAKFETVRMKMQRNLLVNF